MYWHNRVIASLPDNSYLLEAITLGSYAKTYRKQSRIDKTTQTSHNWWQLAQPDGRTNNNKTHGLIIVGFFGITYFVTSTSRPAGRQQI
jgi:hypothetical protein